MSKNKSNLLLDERPLVIIPRLAKLIGLNEAIFMQQLHFWLERSTNERDGFLWVYKTYPEWQEELPFLSLTTIKRTATKLEKDKLVVVGNYNKLKIDKTKWYRIDYDIFNELVHPTDQNGPSEDMTHPTDQNGPSKDQNGPSKGSKRPVEEVNLTPPLPKSTTKSTTEITSETTTTINSGGGAHEVGVADIISFWDNNGFGYQNNNAKNSLLAYKEDGFSYEVILQALVIASEQGKTNFSYVKGILLKWEQNEAFTIEKVNAYNNSKGASRNAKNDDAENEARKYGLPF